MLLSALGTAKLRLGLEEGMERRPALKAKVGVEFLVTVTPQVPAGFVNLSVL